MSSRIFAAACRRLSSAQRAAIFVALFLGPISTAVASPGCNTWNAVGTFTEAISNSPGGISGFAAGDVLTISTSTPKAGVSVGIGDNGTTANLVSDPASVSYTVTAATASHTLYDYALNTSGSNATFTYTCTNAGSVTNTDSTNVRTLQTTFTKAAATVSTQVITTQVAGAISDAFSDGGNPVTVNPNGVSINFAATPKSDIENRTDDAFSALGYAGMPTKAPRMLTPYKEWSAWLDLRGTGWQNHDPAVGMNGSQLNATGGIGRKLTPDLLVGIFTGYEYFKYDVAALAGNVKGTGGSVGSYLGWRMSSTVRFDAALGYTRMAYSATSGTATGSFDGNRFVASSALTGSYGLGMYKIEPSASVYALWEKQSAWTDSLGTAQADRNFSAGRTSLGSKLIREWAYGDTRIAPYAGFYGDWRFSTDNATPGGTPIVGIGDGWSGRAIAGVAFTARSGPSLQVGGEYGGIGAAYKIWTGNVRANVPF
jgi:hypothetical protein